MTGQELLLDKMKEKVVIGGRQFVNPDFVETNSSLILFTGGKAFKILKESKRGIDCSTVLARHTLLEEEMEINSEITAGLYFSIRPIFLSHGQVVINENSPRDTAAIEYALYMKRLWQDSLIYNMLLGDIYSDECSILIAQKIADFHMVKLSRKLIGNDQDLIKKFVTFESLKNIVEKDFRMFEELRINFVPAIITEQRYQEIKRYLLGFLKDRKDLLIERIKLGYVLPIHGDFHSQNIFIEDGVVYVIDRSLRKNMRVNDIIKDLAYLGVDLEIFGFKKQKELFFDEYHSRIKDSCFKDLLPFYMCRRAFVAGMVNLFEEDLERLKAYFGLAYSYAINY